MAARQNPDYMYSVHSLLLSACIQNRKYDKNGHTNCWKRAGNKARRAEIGVSQNLLFPICIDDLYCAQFVPCCFQCSITADQLCLLLLTPHFFLWILFQLFLRRPLLLRSCDVHCSACLATLSSFLLGMYPSQFHSLSRCCRHCRPFTSFSPKFLVGYSVWPVYIMCTT